MTAVATTPTMGSPYYGFSQATQAQDRYRGAVVEDLQLQPAFSLPDTEVVMKAIELAYDRDFSHIPVLNRQRRPIGYVDVADLKAKWEAGQANPDDRIASYMTKFKRSPYEPYTLITPLTSLSDLEEFLERNIFALVTDNDRKFVLGVATLQDLSNFASRSGF